MNKLTWYAFSRRAYHALSILMILAMMLAPTIRVNAYTYTDKPEYTPGSVVTISGDNSDGDAYNFVAQELVKVDVAGPNGYTAYCEATTDDFGAWSCQVTLLEGEIAYGEYSYTATGQVSGNIEYGTFLDGPPKVEQLWQCDPPLVYDPATYECVSSTNTGWVTGNDDGPLYEGDTIPYRTRLQNLIPDTAYSLTIEWDTTKSSKHAIDYLKTFNATFASALPCASLTGLPAGLCEVAPSTWAIPADTFMQSQADWVGTQDPGEFTMYGGVISGLSGYTTPLNYDGDTSTSITVYFTSNSTDIVLAWGGHIGERADWGMNNSAVFISGSPYHMRILTFYDVTNNAKLNVGNTDRSLSAEAVIYPAHVTVIKVADPEGNTEFPFTGNLGDFTLIDDGTATDRKTFDVVTFGDYDITELVPSYWQLDNISCTDSTGTPIYDLATGTATVNILEADEITCTFYDSLQAGDITIIKQTDPDGSTQIFDFTASYDVDGFSLSDGQSNFSGPLMPGTYSVSESVPTGWQLSSATCDDGSNPASIDLSPGEHITCTFTNYRLGQDLTVTKTVTATKDRLYKWLIDKSVDDTLIEIAEGGKATFNYSVKVTPNGYEDSGFNLSGVITISNPNDWEDVVLTSVTDTLDKGGACSITESAPYTVPKSGSLALHYTCTTDGSTTKNTVDISWDKAAYHTPNGSASDAKDVAFSVAKETNKIITVIDDKTDPVHPVTLGTWNWADGEHTFTYSLDQTGVAGTCTDYTNTAIIDETKQSDSQKVTVCVGKDLTVSKTAAGTFDRTYLWKISKDVDQTLVKIAEGGSYTFKYTVVAEQTGISDAGWTLSGKITIANPNDWEAITLTNLTDLVDNGGTCTVDPGPYVIAKSGSIEVGYNCTYASAPSSYSGTNTATATWDKGVYFTPSGSASGSAGFTLAQLGSTNKTIHVTDTYAGDLGTVTATDGTPFAKGTFTYDRTESGVAGKCTEYDNTAKITETGQTADKSVTLCVGKDLTVTKTAAGTFDRLYLWKIEKLVDKTEVKIALGGKATFNYTVKVTPDSYTDSGWMLGGKITVTNPNDWEDIYADVTDVVDIGGGAVCTVTGGTNVMVPKSGSVTLDYSCTFTGQPAYTGKNIATATWDKALYFTPTDTASGDAAVSMTLKGETNRTITVVDDKTTGTPVTLGTSDYYGGPFEYKYTLEKEGIGGTCTDYNNKAEIVETEQTALMKVTVCVGKDLTVTKTAAAKYDREYKWLIDKMVDQTHVDTTVGGLATFNYTVTVTPNGFEDFGWEVHGTITVSNPNDWEAVEVDVTDAVDVGGGAVCTVVGGVDVTVPASGSVTLDYSCTFASLPAYTGINTATATWDMALAHTPTGSASGTADVDFILDQEVNKVVDVWDDKTDPLLPVHLGTATWNDVPTATVFTYSLTKEAGFGCQEYTNTAVIEQTEQEATATIEICGDYWAFTPGFWKNHTATSPSGHDAWQWTYYKTTDKVGDVFDPDHSLSILTTAVPGAKYGALGSFTLLEALGFKGGSGDAGAAQILLRAGTAALLNASFHEYWTDHGYDHTGYYPYTSAEVIALVHAALGGTAQDMLDLAAELDGYNNSAHIIDWDNPPGEF